MAKMIPNFIDQTDPRRNGERLVFNLFADEKIPGTVFYSLLQKNHIHKMIGEVDFLYICKKGILCVEVKGGQNIFRRYMKWYSVNRKGKENEIHNPFKQSMDCMYALRRYLEKVYGKNSKQAQYLLGYSVIFPECIFTGNGNDLVTECMFDCRRSGEEFGKYLEETLNYWSAQEFEKHGTVHNELNKAEINQLEDLLGGDFSVVPSMTLEVQHAEKQMLQLTEEQMDVLDDTEENEKTIIQGVAGTGKSLLAIEKVRKVMASDKNALYVCFNKNMAHYVKLNVNMNDASFIGTYHSLIQKALGQKDLYEKSVSDISDIFLSSSYVGPKYDILVVDEAQDLMIDCVWECLDKFIKGGLENGKWVIFLDPNQNIFMNSEIYDFAYSYLKEMYHPFVCKLNQNCRNTEQIGRRTAVVSSVPPAKHMKVTGPKVISQVYDENENTIKKLLKHDIGSYIGSGGNISEIVILSKYKKDNSAIKDVTHICGCEVVEVDGIESKHSDIVKYYTIHSFKGLEAKVVFLIDMDGFKTMKNRLLNYVAMSRAKILLYMYMPSDKKVEYTEAVLKGQDLLE